MNKFLTIACGTLLSLCAASCNDYIDILPKGYLIPSKLADYEALLRNEYSSSYFYDDQGKFLINDKFIAPNQRTAKTLNAVHFMWREGEDRCDLNSSTEGMFDNTYGIIAIANTIIEAVPTLSDDSSQAERNEVMAYAYAIRAFILHYIVNYYADAYDPAKAAETPGVPLIYSAGLNSPYKQGSVKEVYEQIISDFNKAIELGVPEKSMTVIHPDRAAVEAGLARVYLSMRNYPEALVHAENALKRNSNLFDWIEFYNEHKSVIENPNDYTQYFSPMGHTCIENIWHCNGEQNPNFMSSEASLPTERAESIEPGDCKFFSRWKLMQSQNGDFYKGMLNGYFNLGGISVPEVMLIKAECLARDGQTNPAMEVLNTLRKTRIDPAEYADKTAASTEEAVRTIIRCKHNELINHFIPFIDYKRLNAEGIYTFTFTKTEADGQTYTLRPDSYLWTMVFPANAINRPGNGTLKQNSH